MLTNDINAKVFGTLSRLMYSTDGNIKFYTHCQGSTNIHWLSGLNIE